MHVHIYLYHSCRSHNPLKGTATVYKPHVLRRCLSSQGTSMYPRVHEGCWATVASSQNCETISGYYKSYYGTSHLYHGFLRCMGFVPSCSCMSSLGLCPREDIQLPSGTNPIHLETHGTLQCWNSDIVGIYRYIAAQRCESDIYMSHGPRDER